MATSAPITIRGPYPERFTKPQRAPRTEGWQWQMQDMLATFNDVPFAVSTTVRKGVPHSTAVAYAAQCIAAHGAQA